ncbi:MAG: hypothetical protein ACI8W7_001491 [Gammaproteobacteria bacterium]|jgi:hypothetical protein
MKDESQDTSPTPRETTAALAPTVAEQRTNGAAPPAPATVPPKTEYGGPAGLEPTRYGDWERNGRCYDF